MKITHYLTGLCRGSGSHVSFYFYQFVFFLFYVRLARHAFIAFSECILSFIMLHEGKLGAKLKKKKNSFQIFREIFS